MAPICGGVCSPRTTVTWPDRRRASPTSRRVSALSSNCNATCVTGVLMATRTGRADWSWRLADRWRRRRHVQPHLPADGSSARPRARSSSSSCPRRRWSRYVLRRRSCPAADIGTALGSLIPNMERSVGESPSSRVRAALRGIAGPLEVGAVAVAAIITWRLTLGWNWSAVPTSDPFRHTTPQSGVDWVVFAVVVMAGVGWLGARGRAVAGTVAICAPIVVLSAGGWPRRA